MEFVLIRSHSVAEFNDEVNYKLKCGWRPIGVVFVYNAQYHLAMVKGESC